MRYGAKRSLEELANKSDSDDEDWSEGDARPVSRRGARKSKHSPKKRARPAKKRRRNSGDIVSDDEEFATDDDLSIEESEEEEEDPNVPRNARGTARRRTTQNRPLYEEPDSSEEIPANDEEDDELEEPSPKKKKKGNVVKLKLDPEILARPDLLTTRRTTRHTRGASEDIYALTNSGRHMQTVQRGTKSPTPAEKSPSPAIQRRVPRAVSRATEEPSAEIQASLEVLESDAPAEGDTVIAQSMTQDQADVEMTIDEGVVPESENGDAEDEEYAEDDEDEIFTIRRRGRLNRNDGEEDADFEVEDAPEDPKARPPSRKKLPKSPQRKNNEESDFEPEEDDSNDDEDSQAGSNASPQKDDEEGSTFSRRPGLRARASRSRGQSEVADELAEEVYELRGSSGRRRRPQAEIFVDRQLRRGDKPVDYRILRPEVPTGMEGDEEEAPVVKSPSRPGRGGGGGGPKWERSILPTMGPFGGNAELALLGASDATAAAAAGGADSDSSDDEAIPQPKNLGGMPGGLFGQKSNDPHLAGTPANFGKVKDKQSLADADPLGVDMTVNFDSVGGLQGHIDQLKEMVSLPLLYPEVFQRFHIVPPRGVLFHGPPGTGKTLLARALANSVSSEGRKVSFYMRKGADTLSKWVGEAERQLRLLFEEARKNQPSIIFFDEIDGLAPVRSSKQEQIHASIVSTLLALMDGMDGRGQVVVIGATNRPDSVDPALRRPGRFDREFYFPLPNIEGRRAILDIHTKGWDPALPGDVKDELAKLTKGYGGADLRALCTEAALNSVQRKYPQIYKSDKKLLIDPKKIDVLPKDFMIAVKKMVPSSERSTSSGASVLPHNVEPLLRQTLTDIQKALSEVLPQRKRLTALEEAMYEEPDDGNGFRREQMIQEFDRARVFRPRMLLRGPQGMGQQYLAGALLHHFEGLHVQAFDLPTLLSDSTRSPEAAVIQLFAEVKRHRPSVIYLPNIQSWCGTVGPAVISTFLSLLRSIPPSDPVLLLGVLEDNGDEVDDALLRQLFGFSKKNVFDLSVPGSDARREFFKTLVEYIQMGPSDFPDPENRKKRQLEELEIAPPPPPPVEKPITKEELKAQKRKDNQTLNFLKIRIQPIMDQIKKYRRWRSGPVDEALIRYLFDEPEASPEIEDLPLEERAALRPYERAVDKHGVQGLREVLTDKFFYNLDSQVIEKRLSNGFYKRPRDFYKDIRRIWKDCKQIGDAERVLRAGELVANVDVDIINIENSDPAFLAECEAVYQRELAREKQAIELAQKAKEEERNRLQAEEAAANASLGNTESEVVQPDAWASGAGETSARPVTPTRQSNVTFSNGYQNGGSVDLNEPGPNGNSNGSHGDGDGDVFMSNSEDVSGGRDTQNDSFGPSAQPKPAYSHTAPSQQIRRESGMSSLSQKGPMTPMAPGSQPGDYTNEASTTQTTSYKKSSEQSSNPQDNTQSPHVSRHEYPDLSQYPDRVSQEEHLPDTQQGGSSQPSPRPRDSLASNQTELEQITQHGNQSQTKPQPPLFGDASKPTHDPSNLQSLLIEEPAPELIIDHAYIEHIHGEFTRQTSGCSVEQLEQINTYLMDYVWHMRGEWNRTAVARGVTETFNEVLMDMQEMQAIASMSHDTHA